MAKILNQIKALNERIADIAREFGTDSPIYERYENKINRTIPESMRGTSRNGYIRIKQDKATQKAMESGLASQFEKIRSEKSRGQYLAEKRKQFVSEYGKGRPSKEQLYDYVSTEKKVRRAFESGDWKIAYTNANDKLKEQFRTKGRKSYGQLEQMLNSIGAFPT